MKTEFYTDPTQVFSNEDLQRLALLVIKDNRERIFPNILLEIGIGTEIFKDDVNAFGFIYCTLSFTENENFIEFSIIGISIFEEMPNNNEVEHAIKTLVNMHNAVNLN